MNKELMMFPWTDVPSVSREFTDLMNGKCDFSETDEAYEIEMELPGVKKEEVDILFKDDRVTVKWSRSREKKAKKRAFFERQMGSFSRSFVTEGADPDKITASLKKGVLKIELPKLAGFQAKQIEIH
ncbi:MAG: Hsp20/alpha crystallin family protein [Spirochaetales bacterium]|nr:Hsp20/alpha crystallin family protein [Spirochaetales bacterium]